MRTEIWLAPDMERYTVTIFQEPFDDRQTIAFHRHSDGWIGTASIPLGRSLLDLPTDELEVLFARAKAG